ncbi:glycosyltransferase [Prevotella sp. KH2C16]|uniref:glycosyltransferase n=1 Tax=Prevotella sp. KH2C16 TaxID=1855325 RepID=UPI000B806CB7|nr:glycosyltransferase [Prevotella sp. KH2C16]
MRILQVITSLAMGGAEKLVSEMIPRLRAMGHTVDLAVFNGEETPLMEKLRAENPAIKIYKLGHGYYNPLYILKLSRIMRNYDIVHTHNSSPQLFVAIAKVLCSVGLVSTEHTTSNRKRSWKWYAPIESWMYGQYDHVICISGIAEQKLREYMGGEWQDETSDRYKRISTINNGVDVRAINDAGADEGLLQIKDGRRAILMVAGFREAKDQDTVVRALSLLGKEKFEVWFAGVGVRLETVKALAAQLDVADRIRFLGMRTDIPRVLKAADMVVMSSHWEGLSLSNIEGMASGKPFIASDVNGLREVTHGYGILFPHQDAQALANIIKQLHDNNAYYNKVADACYRRALQYDINKMVAGYEQVYTSLFTKV